MLRILKIRYAHVEERRPYLMAIFHLNVKTISRGKGQSATASSAYRSGEQLYSERYGYSNYYPREVKPVTFILKPEHAPEWALNRERLWNEVEKAEVRKDAQLAREVVVALPIELSDKEQEKLVREYVEENFVAKGMVVDVAIHRDNEGNPHAHIMATIRPFNLDGTWGNKSKTVYLKDENGNQLYTKNGNRRNRKVSLEGWDDKQNLYEWRTNWASITNKYLEKNGFSIRISEKSYHELGEDKIPTIHEGYVAREMDQRGEVSERVEMNKSIRQANYEKQEAQQEEVKQQLSIQILQSYSPKEKIELKKIAENLKVYVNYDNLLDKERMVYNWQRAEKLNKMIQPDSFDTSIVEKIDETKGSIQHGKQLVEDHAVRIYEKYYPELQEETFSRFAKINIGQQSLEKDRKLNDKEILTILKTSLDDEVDSVLKTISSRNYSQSIYHYEKKRAIAHQAVQDFYERNDVTVETVMSLPDDKLAEFKKLYTVRDINHQSVELLEKVYDEYIQSVYPTADLTVFASRQKEVLARAIDYYGTTLSYTKLVEASQQEHISKYNTYEQQIGMRFIRKLENDTMTLDDLNEIEQDYRKREIFYVVSNPVTKEFFLNEVANNEAMAESNVKENVATSNILGQLLKNNDVYEELLRASQENARRENQGRRKKQTKSVKEKKAKSSKKQRQSRTPSL